MKENGLKKWKCEYCKNLFALSEIQCDHIEPVENTIPQSEYEFLQSFHRLHSCKLQILCKECHKKKTKEDLFQQKYTAALLRVSGYLRIYPNDLHKLEDRWSAIQQLERVIKKLEVEKDQNKLKRLEKQLDKLRVKYL